MWRNYIAKKMVNQGGASNIKKVIERRSKTEG